MLLSTTQLAHVLSPSIRPYLHPHTSEFLFDYPSCIRTSYLDFLPLHTSLANTAM